LRRENKKKELYCKEVFIMAIDEKKYIPEAADIEKIIKEGDAVTIIKCAEKFGQYLAQINKDNRNGGELELKPKGNESLSTSQIRNVYGKIKEMQISVNNENFNKILRSVKLIKPKLAYIAERHGKMGVRKFEDVISKAIDKILNLEDFENFCDFFEAIICYHKKFGGQ